jgi:beta-mannosidase
MIRYSKCLLLILFTTICWSLRAQPVQILLNKGWQFSRHADNKWYPATVPGTVHTDLLKNKLIPDPYYRDNENKLQWIGKEDWDYKASFVVEKKAQSKKNVELVFDGLDTYADVYLNGQLILSANNMFRQWRVPVKALLKQTNQLQIRFYSAKNKVDSIAKAQRPYIYYLWHLEKYFLTGI